MRSYSCYILFLVIYATKIFGDVETPSYDIITKTNIYEIRQYQKQLWARNTYHVSPNTDFFQDTAKGFQPLFQYISGLNEKQQKIAMTAPVVTKQNTGGNHVERHMAFIMSPSIFTSLNQLPQPIDQRVKLIEVDNDQRLACIRFSGNMYSDTIAQKEQELRKAVEQDGVKVEPKKDQIQYFDYNPPWTLAQERRNEICIIVVT
ncbi:unnamed protein product [Didymodactylos carnosus]|uniref:SOUL heme-binding protein n=1 Tax=Didymodactylos carnosus TaxID=1234261 RepID=A0A814VKB4_9BILA|nr:unnamed protein product [Didymodactylos carnosus]CAF1218626.1 unnamed protein product [Didymodactylos carnosus]CAF3956187.1 unnamed protein product [Didymodactylos carnosus]CAF4026795.1 unnamed protein product [Didymodactylos carnosus]